MNRVKRIINQCYPDSRIIDITVLRGGISGSLVTKVLLKNGLYNKKVVVKVGPKVFPEKEGYKLLGKPLKQYLPQIYFEGPDYLVMEYFESLGMFNEILGQNINQELFKCLDLIVDDILKVKARLWLNNQRSIVTQSIFRAEWDETLKLLTPLLNKYAMYPLYINGRQYPCLNIILKKLERVLFNEQEYLPVLSHGDLKGDNILLTKNLSWKIVDLEWAGSVDWVESLIRIGKWCSSKTMELCFSQANKKVINQENVLALDYKVHFDPKYLHFQKKVKKFGYHFSVLINDYHWKKRWDAYLAASLLREIVLLKKRGFSEEMWIPLIGYIAKIVEK